MTIRFRIIFLILFIFTILVASSPLILGLASTAFSYSGKCYGFTDGVWACPWYEYATMQIFWSGLLTIPLALTLLSGWLVTAGFWLTKRRTSTPNRLPLWQVLLIPVVACIGGVFLISALPVAINIFDKPTR